MKQVKVSGEIVELEVRKYSVEELQKLVGGYFELTHNGIVHVLCDEEGLLKKKEINTHVIPRYGVYYVGDVVIFETEKELKKAMN